MSNGILYRPIAEDPRYLVLARGEVWSSVSGTMIKLTPTTRKDGYLKVNLSKGGKKKATLYVHKLIAEAFLGRCPPGQMCRHIDDDRNNCRLDNLAYGSPQQNSEDAVKNGRIKRGQGLPQAKLTEAQVHQIVELSEAGVARREIAARFSVKPKAVSDILSGRSWSHITGIPKKARERRSPKLAP
jgi:HNH endonuclease